MTRTDAEATDLLPLAADDVLGLQPHRPLTLCTSQAWQVLARAAVRRAGRRRAAHTCGGLLLAKPPSRFCGCVKQLAQAACLGFTPLRRAADAGRAPHCGGDRFERQRLPLRAGRLFVQPLQQLRHLCVRVFQLPLRR